MRKMYWTVRVGVDRTWVADGFDLTNDHAKSMLADTLPHALGHELSARVLERPDATAVRLCQGGRVRERSPFDRGTLSEIVWGWLDVHYGEQDALVNRLLETTGKDCDHVAAFLKWQPLIVIWRRVKKHVPREHLNKYARRK